MTEVPKGGANILGQVMARAIRESEGEKVYVRAMKRLCYASLGNEIPKVFLPVEISPHARRRFFAIAFGQRGKPSVVTPLIQRSLAMCSFKAEELADPKSDSGQQFVC